jgi:hypothetical protein
MTFDSRRIPIPLNGSDSLEFYTFSDLLVARGFTRVVIGERGPYIEFSDSNIIVGSVYVPQELTKRLGNDLYYYDEYRTIDTSMVMLYKQKKTVDYADYKVGMWYISPRFLKTKEHPCLLLPIDYFKSPEKTLFDAI